MTPFTAALVAAAEGGGGGLTDFDTTLYWATLAMFGLFALVLGKFAWGPLLGIIEDREKSVRSAVEEAQQANAEARKLLEQHREMVREAGRERAELIERAVAEAEQVRNDLVAKARSEGDQLVQRAREQIGRETAAAIQDLRAQVGDLAVEAASRIVTSSLTPENQRKLVDDFIRELPKA
jgi:F-type H+-transporting ATPase subunit b